MDWIWVRIYSFLHLYVICSFLKSPKLFPMRKHGMRNTINKTQLLNISIYYWNTFFSPKNPICKVLICASESRQLFKLSQFLWLVIKCCRLIKILHYQKRANSFLCVVFLWEGIFFYHFTVIYFIKELANPFDIFDYLSR